MKMPTERKGHKYLKRVIVTIILLGAIGYGGWYIWRQYESVDRTTRFEGEVACLPLSSSPEPPDKTTCDKGLKTKDRLYFVLEDVLQARLKIGEKVAVKGSLEPVTAEIDGYEVAGIITGELIVAKR